MSDANSNKILITGASGLVGKRLTELLLAQGFEVNTLGRKPQRNEKHVKHFVWNVEKQTIDEKALDGVKAIVHLAGAGVADERWTATRKKEILESRINSARLLFQTLSSIPHSVECVVSASAVGYYGDAGAVVLKENAPPAKTFLADVCVQWEQAISAFSKLNIREVRLRIGIVLAKNGGALPELSKTIPLGIAGYFSKHPLFYPWIHIDDVCGIFIHAIKNNSVSGAYNTTAPKPLELKDLMSSIVKGMGKKALLVPAPPFALKLAMGEMAEMLLSSQNCSAEKIEQSGYRFLFKDAAEAVKNLVG
jgi:uncharacterized protein (TIGR01777 family)